jgi:hypothetical protein
MLDVQHICGVCASAYMIGGFGAGGKPRSRRADKRQNAIHIRRKRINRRHNQRIRRQMRVPRFVISIRSLIASATDADRVFKPRASNRHRRDAAYDVDFGIGLHRQRQNPPGVAVIRRWAPPFRTPARASARREKESFSLRFVPLPRLGEGQPRSGRVRAKSPHSGRGEGRPYTCTLNA